MSAERVDAQKPLPYEDNSFDVIYVRLLFHYFNNADQERLLKEISRVLKPGGKVVIQTKSKNDSYFKGSKEALQDGFYRFRTVTLEILFSAEELKGKFKAAGFEVSENWEENEQHYGNNFESTLVTSIGIKKAEPASTRGISDTGADAGAVRKISPIITQNGQIKDVLEKLRLLKGQPNVTDAEIKSLAIQLARAEVPIDIKPWLRKIIKADLLWCIGHIRGDPELLSEIIASSIFLPEEIRSILAAEGREISSEQLRALKELRRTTVAGKYFETDAFSAFDVGNETIEQQLNLRNCYYHNPYNANVRKKIEQRIKNINVEKLKEYLTEKVRERMPDAEIEGIIINGSYLYGLEDIGVSDLDILIVIKGDSGYTSNEVGLTLPPEVFRDEVHTETYDLAIKTDGYFRARQLANSQETDNKISLLTTLWGTGIVIGIAPMSKPTPQHYLMKARQLLKVSEGWQTGERDEQGNPVPVHRRYTKSIKRLVEAITFMHEAYGSPMTPDTILKALNNYLKKPESAIDAENIDEGLARMIDQEQERLSIEIEISSKH